jgi:hypothetical protein
MVLYFFRQLKAIIKSFIALGESTNICKTVISLKESEE